MTQQTGSNTEEDTGPPPWERKWNDIKVGVSAVVDKAVETARKPWEMDWGWKQGDSRPGPVKEPVATPKPVQSDLQGDWKTINASYAQGQAERDKSQLQYLQYEYDTATSAADKAAAKRSLDAFNKGGK